MATAVSSDGLVFVSYHRLDRGATSFGRIKAKLESRYHCDRVWVDFDDTGPGPWRDRVMAGVAGSDVLICVIGPSWREETQHPEDECAREVKAAKAAGIPILPIRINDAPVPADLSSFGYRRVRTASVAEPDMPDDFDNDMKKVFDWVDEYVPPAKPPPPYALIAGIAAVLAVMLWLAVILWPSGGGGEAASEPLPTTPTSVPTPTTIASVPTPTTVASVPTHRAPSPAPEPSHRVVGVDPDDPDGGLNVRTVPDMKAGDVLAVFRHDAASIEVRDRRDSWALAAVLGWADQDFLEGSSMEVSCPAGFGPSAVTGVEEDDPDGGLNVRAEPRGDRIAVLMWDAEGFCSAQIAEGGWRQVIVAGWVSSSYLAAEG